MGHRVRVLIPLRATQITYSHHWERVLPAAAASERRRRRRRLTREKEAVGGQLQPSVALFSRLRIRNPPPLLVRWLLGKRRYGKETVSAKVLSQGEKISKKRDRGSDKKGKGEKLTRRRAEGEGRERDARELPSERKEQDEP